VAVAVVAAAALVPTTSAASSPTPASKPQLTKERATALFLGNDKVADWLDRYPRTGRVTDATYAGDASKCSAGAQHGCWAVHVWWSKNKHVDAGEIAQGKVDDGSARVTEAWTGPQVAWKMARGSEGAFGGKRINSLRYWLPFCFLFLLGLADYRRPLSLRNLDLLVLLSLSVPLWFFNHGDVFTSTTLVYPPLLYLLGRCVWIGLRGRPTKNARRPLWAAWVLLGLAVFLGGYRIGLNYGGGSNVIDVGYAGVIGANRIANGVVPYGNFPEEGSLKACGPADPEGEIRDRIQKNGRCESANPQGDTYGPVAYEAYLPGYWIFGWSGKWDSHLGAVHFTSVLFDVLCLLGLGLIGLRFGGPTLGAALAFAWAAYPFTLYVSMSNTNDAIVPAFLIFGFWLVSSPWLRGAGVALAGWTKFAPLIVAPLWLTYPGPVRRPRALAFAGGFAIATALAFSILVFDGHPIQALQTFYERTLKSQITRESPFSLWDWAQYHARGIPDLHVVQRVLEGLLVLGAVAAAFVPRTKTPLQLAALTGALLIGFEVVLTHWFYLYIPWFFPFVVFALLSNAPEQSEARV
jgi:hypothetical protein